MTPPIVYLDDLQIAGLLKQGRIIPCIRHACAVCGQAVHDWPDRLLARPQCSHGCRLAPVAGGCRLCGEPLPQSKYKNGRLYCVDHGAPSRTTDTYAVPDGAYTMRFVDHHFHAAQGAGPVTQYTATQQVEVAS